MESYDVIIIGTGAGGGGGTLARHLALIEAAARIIIPEQLKEH